MQRAFIYCRVSTDEQARQDHYSLEVQENTCRDYAKRKGWQIVDLRKDVGSGRNDKRPGYQDLLTDIGHRDIDIVVVYRLDRLSRNVRDVYSFLDQAREAGIGFVSTSENFDTTTAMGRAMLGVAAVFAQLTREMIAENVRDGLAKRALSGKYNGPKGKLSPLGYDYDVGQGKLVVNKAEAKTVRRIFEMSGRHKWGLTRICRQLNSDNIRGKRGGQWCPTGLRGLLRSPIYAGNVRRNGDTVAGEHQAIIDPELYAETQALLDQRSTLPPRSQQSQHLLSGIARCGRCGKRLVAHFADSRSSSGKVYRQRFYHHRKTFYTDHRACNGVSKSADRLEEAVLARIREMASSPTFQEAAFAKAKEQLARDLPMVQHEREELQAQLREMDLRFNRWAEMLDSGAISEHQFRERNSTLVEQQAALQRRLTELEAREAESEGVEVELEAVKRMLKDFDTTWAHLTLDERREMLRALVEELNVWKDRAELKLVLMPPVEIDLRFARGRAAAARCS
jgi:site-specific DNA recombinase